MNNNIKLVLFGFLFVTVVVLSIIGCSKVLKVDEFHKAAVIFIVDSSASNQKNLETQKTAIKRLCSMLDPEDHIKLMRVSEKSYIIYEGSPQVSLIRKSLDKFTQYDKSEYGTSYGLAINKAIKHCENMAAEGYIPAIVVIGDLENEGNASAQIKWKNIPIEIAKTKAKTGKLSMFFLCDAPDKLDLVKEKLGPVLGEKYLIVETDYTSNNAFRRFLAAIGR